MSTSVELVLVDEYGFLSPRDTNAAVIGAPLHSMNSYWTIEALAKEENWWASDFLLYLSWKTVLCTRSVEPVMERADSNSHASSPAHSDHHRNHPQKHEEHTETDTALMERWFWDRWEARLRHYGGCPHMSLRMLLWGFFSGAWQQTTEVQEQEIAQYTLAPAEPDPLLMVTDPDYAAAFEAISRDVGRTFPHHILFHGEFLNSLGQQQLQRLLCAYAARDPEVGYCQGMAFVAAVVLMVAPEPQAYQIYCALMRDDDVDRSTLCRRSGLFGRHHGMRQLYRSGFPLLQTLLSELEHHIRLLLPALAAHLQANEVHVAMFASKWFLTLFVHQLPLSLLLRVWDLFLVRGWTVMVQAAVALLHQEQGELLKLSLEGILLHLRTMRTPQQNEKELLRRVCNVPQL